MVLKIPRYAGLNLSKKYTDNLGGRVTSPQNQ